MRKIDLYDHNRIAFEKAEQMLNEDGKAAIIHPTGTGKSYIAFALIEKHQDKRFVWLAPSEYIYNLQVEKLWQKQHVRFSNIYFYTYNRLMWHEEEIDDLKPDYVILDEFHRAGAIEWGRITRELLDRFPDAKVLGLSATNIRYLDQRRDMANELFEGSVASEMSLCDAMAKGILPEPKYVIASYAYDERIERMERRVEIMQNGYCREKSRKTIEKLRRALEQAGGMAEVFKRHLTDKHGKVILFCRDAEHMFEMVARVPEWFGAIDKAPKTYRVYTHNPESEEAFFNFTADDSDHLKLLFCIDMLNEGIHVDGVSAVVLCRPTVSPIVYKQQIGRAIAAGSVKKPVIFDLVNNFESLHPIDDLQKEYDLAKASVKQEKVNNEDLGGFEIIDELRDCRELMQQIQKNLDTSWDECFREYMRFVEENGTTRVPRRYITEDGLRLGKWVQRQRAKYRDGRLIDEQVEMLEQLGISWESVSDERFNRWVELLRLYKEEHGDVNVPLSFVWQESCGQCENLGQWCANIRGWYRQGKMPEDRQKILEELGFSWDTPEYYWTEGYNHAKAYYDEYGDIGVEKKYICEDGYRLGVWVARQRRIRRGTVQGNLDEEKIAKLDELGMDWIGKPTPDSRRFIKSLKQYIEDNGNDVVPCQYVDKDGVRLGSWLSCARMENRKGTLSERKRRLLSNVGFTFHEFTYQWFAIYQTAKKYYEEHGNLAISLANNSIENRNLNQWVSAQRRAYRQENHGRLSDEQVELLEKIDIGGGSRYERDFERGFSEFKLYVEEHDDGIVPIDYKTEEGFKLGDWISNQKDAYYKGKIRKERYQRLTEAGMIWDNFETVRAERFWEEMLQEARNYAAEYGTIKHMPVTYVTPEGKKLGQWMAQQRRIRKGTLKHSIEMTEKRIRMLDEIGMDWEPPLYKHTDKRKEDDQI